MAYAAHELLTSLLRDVSRSFYLTLRVLPSKIRPQIGLAYLLARTTDTIADTGLVSLETRLSALQALRRRILGQGQDLPDFGELARTQASAAEAALLQHLPSALALLEQMPSADRQRVRELLEIIGSGQELDLRRFASASPARPAALLSEAELDDYTYRVAGCVGEFWTRLCHAHLFPGANISLPELLANGARFGKGLQLVNVLRDLPVDLRQGRCYLPEQSLAELGLQPADLFEPGNEPQLRPLYNKWLDRAQGHLEAGWTYTLMLPRNCIRVRLACAWPLLIGRQTLSLLRAGNILQPGRRLKISRVQVRRIIVRSVVCYPFARKWEGLFTSLE
jgi:farnesyl-diphosphate farnesyltransferase